MRKDRFGDRDLDIDRFIKKCKQHKLKLTPQRLMLYRELVKSREHPSAEKLFKRAKKVFPNISFDTVNRTLLTFSRVGIVRVVEGYGNPRRFDPNLLDHHHFRCLRCDDIVDIYNPAYDNLKIPPVLEKQYRVLSKRVILEGFCNQCQKHQTR